MTIFIQLAFLGLFILMVRLTYSALCIGVLCQRKKRETLRALKISLFISPAGIRKRKWVH